MLQRCDNRPDGHSIRALVRDRGPLPCLNRSTGRLNTPLPWGDPTARQVPLFIRWEDYSDYLPADLRGVRFVQIGANCGKNTYGCAVGGDPIWSYATMCGWHGIAIEPVSYTFAKLCRNYLRWPHVTPARGAVADKPGTAFMKLSHGEGNKLLSDQERHGPTVPGSQGPRRRIKNESVPQLSLTSLWAQRRTIMAEAELRGSKDAAGFVATGAKSHGVRQVGIRSADVVDILAIDAEGAEGLILGGADPLPHPRPSLILFEHVHLPPSEQTGIDDKLRREGYTRLTDLRNKDPRGSHMPPANRLYGLQHLAVRTNHRESATHRR